MSPSPQQSSQSSVEAMQWQIEVESGSYENSKVNIGGLLVKEWLLREWSST